MAGSRSPRIRVGVAGWVYEPWRGAFYPDGLPQKSELDYASRKLTSIEINGTYYGTQKAESFAKWHAATPDDFVFAVKGPRFATNRRILADAGPSIAHFFSSGVMALAEKLGPVNWQFAPTKKFDAKDFEAFLKLLPTSVAGRGVRHAVEVRHDSFRNAEFVALARDHSVAIVTAADSHYPQIADVTAPFVYARIMGTSEGESAGYPDAGLDLWAEHARQWASGGEPAGLERVMAAPAAGPERDVFLYFINGYKVANPLAAMALMERLG